MDKIEELLRKEEKLFTKWSNYYDLYLYYKNNMYVVKHVIEKMNELEKQISKILTEIEKEIDNIANEFSFKKLDNLVYEYKDCVISIYPRTKSFSITLDIDNSKILELTKKTFSKYLKDAFISKPPLEGQHLSVELNHHFNKSIVRKIFKFVREITAIRDNIEKTNDF